MESNPIGRVRGRLRKTIGKIIKRDMNVNGLNTNMIYDRIPWHRLIQANPT